MANGRLSKNAACAKSAKFETLVRRPYTLSGGERGPVTPPVFKAGDTILRGLNGGFDFHTPPP